MVAFGQDGTISVTGLNYDRTEDVYYTTTSSSDWTCPTAFRSPRPSTLPGSQDVWYQSCRPTPVRSLSGQRQKPRYLSSRPVSQTPASLMPQSESRTLRTLASSWPSVLRHWRSLP